MSEDKFWAKVKQFGQDGCWEWTGGTSRDGYGIFSCDGQKMRAHRFVWALTHGPIPDGMCVRHTCDNPPCVRLDHLLLGTRMENNRDKALRGRGHGKRRSRKQPEHVEWLTVQEMAKSKGVEESTIRHAILAGRIAARREGKRRLLIHRDVASQWTRTARGKPQKKAD